MKYYSLNKQAPGVDFREAVINGQAPDKGLYFPEQIPQNPPGFLGALKELTKCEIAYHLIKPYVGTSISNDDLFTICSETVDFEFPLVKLSDELFTLELFHGPTLAFKDVGARFMSRCLSHFNKDRNRETTVLVATSGDTGSAVADAFLGVEGVRVVILFPSGKVSGIQELQLTTNGKNITALEVQGNFDDCQRLVKSAFADKDLRHLSLSSANSINVARWLPQQFYYYFALQQWPYEQMPVMSVPSGNFGNICAGLLAQVAGAPYSRFIAACNSNRFFGNYLETGETKARETVHTISNAMDVGLPSNFVRVFELLDRRLERIREKVIASNVSDDETIHTMKSIFSKYNYLCDPHGAVACTALQDYLKTHPGEKGIFLETAHPAKFSRTVEEATGQLPEVPEEVVRLNKKEKLSIRIKAQEEVLKAILLS